MEAGALSQSGPLWGQEYQDSSDQGRPWGKAGDSPPSHWTLAAESTRGTRPGAGQGGQLVREGCFGFNVNPFCGREA